MNRQGFSPRGARLSKRNTPLPDHRLHGLPQVRSAMLLWPYGPHQGASMPRFLASLGLIATVFVPSLFSQDTRTVTEPVIPPFCASLDAHLTSVNDDKFNTLAPADESKLDTERIQKAIDTCGKGKAVALQAKGTANTFLGGPLELREGVTLVVDKGVTLFETLDPAVMEASPGSCGIVSTRSEEHTSELQSRQYLVCRLLL